MARTIQQIKKSMTDQFMAEPVIREKYGLKESDTFDSAFSTVSIENILFGIIASAAYMLEILFDHFTESVEQKIVAAIPATLAWYHKICLDYQHGDELILDEATQQYVYPEVDQSKRKIKHAAVRDKGSYVYILVSGADAEGLPAALPGDIITPFESYLKARKPAGVQLEVHTYNPDDILIELKIQYDPLVISPSGSLISDTSRYPVEEAIESYLRGIDYGGIFNKTRLVDAVQRADGVLDLELVVVSAKAYTEDEYIEIAGNNYESVGGACKARDLRNNITYVSTTL